MCSSSNFVSCSLHETASNFKQPSVYSSGGVYVLLVLIYMLLPGDIQKALCEDKATKPPNDAFYNLSGCSLSAIEKPIGFCVKPVGASQPLMFNCESEEDQVPKDPT